MLSMLVRIGSGCPERMRSIISLRAALAAACITSRLGGLPAPPQIGLAAHGDGLGLFAWLGPKPSMTWTGFPAW
jgi:hypothetical protein